MIEQSVLYNSKNAMWFVFILRKLFGVENIWCHSEYEFDKRKRSSQPSNNIHPICVRVCLVKSQVICMLFEECLKWWTDLLNLRFIQKFWYSWENLGWNALIFVDYLWLWVWQIFDFHISYDWINFCSKEFGVSTTTIQKIVIAFNFDVLFKNL